LTATAQAVQVNRPYLHRFNISSFQSIISIVPQTRDAEVIRDK